jgi:putative transposase
MPRSARIVLPDIPHHVTQRGNNRQVVFLHDDDYLQYLSLIKEYSTIYNIAIHAYCLMPNHIHLVLIPPNEDALSEAVGKTHYKYSLYFNKKYSKSGHLWQSRFYSCPLDEPHYWKAIRYVERNPVRAKIVSEASQYKWSSAYAHLNKKDVFGLLDKKSMDNFIQPDAWRELLVVPESDFELQKIRQSTISGRKLGNIVIKNNS